MDSILPSRRPPGHVWFLPAPQAVSVQTARPSGPPPPGGARGPRAPTHLARVRSARRRRASRAPFPTDQRNGSKTVDRWVHPRVYTTIHRLRRAHSPIEITARSAGAGPASPRPTACHGTSATPRREPSSGQSRPGPFGRLLVSAISPAPAAPRTAAPPAPPPRPPPGPAGRPAPPAPATATVQAATNEPRCSPTMNAELTASCAAARSGAGNRAATFMPATTDCPASRPVEADAPSETRPCRTCAP